MNDLIDKIKHVFKPEDTISKGKDDPNNKTNLNVEANSSIKLTMTVSGQSTDNSAWASGQFFNYTTGTCINYYPLAFTISSGTVNITSITGTVSGLTSGSTVVGKYLDSEPSDYPSYNPFSWNGPGWYLVLTVPDSDSLNTNQLQNNSTFDLTATATDASGVTATFSFSGAQVEAAPYYPTYTLPNATVGKKYTYTVTPTNTNYVQVDGQDGDDLIWMSIPDWLEDNSQADPNGVFAYVFNGTPTKAGTYTIKGQNQNYNGLQCGNYTFTITVDPAETESTPPSSSDNDKTKTSTPTSSSDDSNKSSTPSDSDKSSTTPTTPTSSSSDKTEPSTPAPTPPVVKTTPHVTLSLGGGTWAYGANNLLVGGIGGGQGNNIYVPLNVEFTDSTDTTTACDSSSCSFIIKSATGLSNTSAVTATVLQSSNFGTAQGDDILPTPANAYGPTVSGATGCYLLIQIGNVLEYFEDVNTYTGQPSFTNGVRSLSVEVEVEFADTSGTTTITYTDTQTFTFNLDFLVGGCIMESTGNTGTNGYSLPYPLLPGVSPGGTLSCSIPLYTTSDVDKISVSNSSDTASWIKVAYSNGQLVFSGTAPSTAMTQASTFNVSITDGLHTYVQPVAYIVIDDPQVTTGNYTGENYEDGNVAFEFNEEWLKAAGGEPSVSLYGPTQIVYLPLTGFPSEYTGFQVSGATVNNSSQVGPNFPEGTTVTCQYLSKQPTTFVATPENPWTGPGYYIVISIQNGQDFWSFLSGGSGHTTSAGYEASLCSLYVFCNCEGNVNLWYGTTMTLNVSFNYAPKFVVTETYNSTIGFPINHTLTSQNNCPSSQWSISKTSGFPTGITATQTGNDIVLSGTPKEAGTFNGQITLSCNTGGMTNVYQENPSLATVTVPMQIAADADVADESYSFTLGFPSTGWVYGENNILVIGQYDAMTVSLPLQPVFKNITKNESCIIEAKNYTCKLTNVTGLSNNSSISLSTPDVYSPAVCGPLNPLTKIDNATYLVLQLEGIPLYFNQQSNSETNPSFVNGTKEITVELSGTYVDPDTGKSFTSAASFTFTLIFLQSGYDGYVTASNITKNAAFSGYPTLPVWNTSTSVKTSIPLTTLSSDVTVTKGSNFPNGIDVSYSDGALVFSGTTSSTSMTGPGKLEVNVKDGSNSYTLTFAYFVTKFTQSTLSGPFTNYEIAAGTSSTPVVTTGIESIFLSSSWEAVAGQYKVVLPEVTNLYIPVTITKVPPISIVSENPLVQVKYLESQPSDYGVTNYNPWEGAGYYAVVSGTAEELQALPNALTVYLSFTYTNPYGGSNVISMVQTNTLTLDLNFAPAPQFDTSAFPSCYVGTPYQETIQDINNTPFELVSTSGLPDGITFTTKELGPSFIATGTATKAGTYNVEAVVNVEGQSKAPITFPFTVLPALPKVTKVTDGNEGSGTEKNSGTDNSSTPSSTGDTPTSKGDNGKSENTPTPAPSTPDKTTPSPTPSTGSGDGDTKAQSSGTTPPKSDTPPVSNNPTPPKTTSPPTPTIPPLKFSYPKSSTIVSTTQSIYFAPTVSGGEAAKDYVIVGEFPQGLHLNLTTGVISGRITIPGNYLVKVQCFSGSQNATSTVSITVVNPLSISYGSIIGVTGNKVSVSPTVYGGRGSISYSVNGVTPSSVAGAPIPLPGVTGLFLNPLTGEISGTPLTSVITAIKVSGSDGVEQATAIVNIDVENPIIMIGTLPEQSLNKAFNFTPAISGGTPSKYVYSYSCEGGLPEGVTFNANTCTLSGTCTTVVSGCNITLTCTDGISTAHLTVTLNITPPLAIIPDQTAVFSDGVSGKYVLQGSNLGENPVWAITNGSLPSGLNLVNGTIIGETTAVGSYTLTLAVKAPINTASGILTLNVIEDLNISPPLPTGTVGLPYTFTPEVSGGNAKDYYFSLSVLNNKSLMSGLVFSTTNGSITGVPTSAGSIQVVITVTDGKSTKSTATLSLTINGVVTTQPSGNNNDTTFTQLLQKYVTLLTSPTVTPAMRSKAIQCISQATNLMLSTPTSTMFETMYQYQVQYQTTLFVDTNFFLGNSVLTSQDQAKLSGVYNAFRTLVTNPELNVSWDYIGQSPINNIPLLNWLQNKQKTLQQLQTQK